MKEKYGKLIEWKCECFSNIRIGPRDYSLPPNRMEVEEISELN